MESVSDYLTGHMNGRTSLPGLALPAVKSSSSEPPTSAVRDSSKPRPWETDPSLSLAERIAGVPPDGLVKGWLVHSIVEHPTGAGIRRRCG